MSVFLQALLGLQFEFSCSRMVHICLYQAENSLLEFVNMFDVMDTIIGHSRGY